jgi:hypothetical protein
VGAGDAPTSVPGVLHPVGKLPAAVYWRRRLVVLAVLLAFLGGGTWLGFALAARGEAEGAESSSSASRSHVRVPALDRVLPSVESIRTPGVPATAEVTAAEVAPAPGPAAGGPCTDDMIALAVRTPGSAAVGSKATFELVVQNVSAVPCTRALDKGLQELLLHDPAGNRLWGSNDCFPEASTDPRTLGPGETVAFPVVWGGLTSEPTCTAARVPPAPGSYLLRGRLDTKVSPDVAFSLV